MNDNVRSPLEGLAEYGRRKGIVYDKRDTVLVGDIGITLDIKDRKGWICYGLTEESLRVWLDQSFDLLITHLRSNADALDPEALECHIKKIDGPAVDLRRSKKGVSG